MNKLLLGIIAFSSPLFSQIYDFDEPRQEQKKSNQISEDTVSDELPTPLQEKSAPPSTYVVSSGASLGSMPGEDFKTASKLARMGAGLYFAGLGIEYGLGLPLSLAAVANNDPGLAIGGLVASLTAVGFQMSGPIRNGIGASLAYDVARRQGLNPDKNINWGFYKAGWTFSAVGGVLNSVVTLGGADMDIATAGTIQLIAVSCSIVSDVMWTVGVINSLSYVRKAKEAGSGHSRLSVVPVYSSAQKSAGAVAVWTF